jgi:hypothetical protein
MVKSKESWRPPGENPSQPIIILIKGFWLDLKLTGLSLFIRIVFIGSEICE